jgi:uncharacterized sulfatase
LLLVRRALASRWFAPAVVVAQPNVVLIIADDQSWTDFGFMGHDVIETPRIDRLAHPRAPARTD